MSERSAVASCAVSFVRPHARTAGKRHTLQTVEHGHFDIQTHAASQATQGEWGRFREHAYTFAALMDWRGSGMRIVGRGEATWQKEHRHLKQDHDSED